MLVLTRKFRERIVIGDNIVVEVLSIRGRKVRLGVDAPRGVKVLRGELASGGRQSPDDPAADAPGSPQEKEDKDAA